MKKQDFIRKVAENSDFSQKQIKEVLDVVETTLVDVLSTYNAEEGAYEEVTLLGAKFSVKLREAREAVNPQNPSEKIAVEAKMVPKVKPMTVLKRACESLEIR